MSHGSNPPAGTLAELIAETTGTSPLKCYQCGRCSAGCMQNVPGEMDVSPTRIMRLLQLEAAFAGDHGPSAGYARRALAADTPWLCAGCLACTTRCPQGVDVAGVMDVLREEGLRRGVASTSRRARDIQALHRTFVRGVLSRGRLHELALILGYKLRTGHFLQDAALGPAMLKRGKIHVLPGKAVDTRRVRAAAERTRPAGQDGPSADLGRAQGDSAGLHP
ncbi:MAG: heterodisulfide reductase subunit C [Phycisphaerae bacterium]|jgi:heterodisulfide reductase subunit B